MTNLSQVPGSHLQPGPIPAFVGDRQVNRQMKDFCLPTFQINQNTIEKSDGLNFETVLEGQVKISWKPCLVTKSESQLDNLWKIKFPNGYDLTISLSQMEGAVVTMRMYCTQTNYVDLVPR